MIADMLYLYGNGLIRNQYKYEIVYFETKTLQRIDWTIRRDTGTYIGHRFILDKLLVGKDYNFVYESFSRLPITDFPNLS